MSDHDIHPIHIPHTLPLTQKRKAIQRAEKSEAKYFKRRKEKALGIRERRRVLFLRLTKERISCSKK